MQGIREIPMATLTIRNVESRLKERLRMRAARNGRSMESELRHILSDALGGDGKRETNLAEAIRRRFLPFGGVDQLEPHPPAPIGNPPVVDQI
jgi:plasmid stability protein